MSGMPAMNEEPAVAARERQKTDQVEVPQRTRQSDTEVRGTWAHVTTRKRHRMAKAGARRGTFC